MVDEKLEKGLAQIKRMGGYPVVKDAASFMNPKYKMIVVYLDEAQKRLYQVQIYDTEMGKVVSCH